MTLIPNRSNRPRHAFTLIELMIAISLGMLVVYIAMAGLRTAVQSISLAQRMATENAIIRTGMAIALNNTDLWVNHDDPSDFGNLRKRQELRKVTTSGSTPFQRFQGLIFTPFKSNPLYGVSGERNTSGQLDAGGIEDATGWDPNAWGAHEARGWAWGNLVERVPARVHAGRNADGTPLKDRNGNQTYWGISSLSLNDSNRAIRKRQIFGVYHRATSTDASVPHRWQQRQLDGLKRTLGSYGLFDYLPANTGLLLYTTRHNANSAAAPDKWWAVAPEWCSVFGGKDNFYLGTDWRSEGWNYAQDIMLATLGTVYAPANPNKKYLRPNGDGDPRPLGELRDICNRRYGTGISLDINYNDDTVRGIRDLLAQVEVAEPWLDHANGTAPETWPGLKVATLRHFRTGASVCLNRITWTNPLTGSETEFSFTAFGTTLRGARQQRLRDEAGWADPFPETGVPKPNLDSY